MAAAAALALSACGGTGVHQAAETTPTTAATGTTPATRDIPATVATASDDRPAAEPAAPGRPVAQWLRVGGLAAPGLGAVRPPALVVYADGRAIAGAAHELRLPPAEVETLVKALEQDLAGQPATASPRPGSPAFHDAPTTILGVDGGGGMREVHVPYLEQAATRYDAALVTARDRLSHLAGRVTARGRTYSTDRVRLSAERLASSRTTAEPLPEGVPLPPDTQATSTRKDYKGHKATAIARLVPGDGSWHVYRLPTGGHLALSWRYLLPHE
ncbi:hypothetical protein OUY22_14665 [Nonomuraea sp. MCN248]|uniref:Lipoprotein n=1 Tax=Nonomuraea corallina TaxID=2989783 RepID=A0ABT4SBT4_9ACTN|nr:hypothetical protein [Nonomuraea corallina]MDA0634663.1 hypothetical protein [Nonomuraea corallina]